MMLARRLLMAIMSRVSEEGDPYWANVVLCVMAEGTVGSKTFTDHKGKVVTASSDVVISDAPGYSAFSFDGESCYMAVGSSTADIQGLFFGNSDFTIDYFLRKTANVANSSRLWNADGDFYHDIGISISAAGDLSCCLSSNGTSWNLLPLTVVANLANNTDYFIRFTREGGTLRCGINGTSYVLTTTLGTATLYGSLRSRCWGGQYTGTSRSLNGFIRGIRVTTGVARDISEVLSYPFPTN